MSSDSDDYSDDGRRDPAPFQGYQVPPFPNVMPSQASFPDPRVGGVYGGRDFPPGHLKFGRSVTQKVADLVEMGYPKKRVEETLALVDNKFDDALQLLMDTKDEEMKWQPVPKELLEEPQKPKEMTQLERQNTEEQIEEIEFQTKKRKFEHDSRERDGLMKQKTDILQEVSKIYERCKAAFAGPPKDSTSDEAIQWLQTQMQNELRHQHDYVQTLQEEVKLQEDANEQLKQKMKLDEIDYLDTKLAREYDKNTNAIRNSDVFGRPEHSILKG
eukprot:TRINITY_DN3708_c0_g1_i1.p1 TRINITY_DN3708_c0_g1~~TRINITY_DN3708_c0_g1_i1.p1  ORF type:complete len:272 (+),score=55.36 TRINITY_DN3708_c0_g1_i1:88-903(+)